MRFRSAATGTAAHADAGCAKIHHQSPHEGAVEVLLAENAPALRADAALDEVHAAAALIAVRGDLRVAEDLELGHA